MERNRLFWVILSIYNVTNLSIKNVHYLNHKMSIVLGTKFDFVTIAICALYYRKILILQIVVRSQDRHQTNSV